MLTLFTDTDTDITPQVADKYGYQLISMPLSIEGKDIYPYKSFKIFESHDYYEKLRKGLMPKTSSLSPETYKNYFEPFFKKGSDILYVHFSSVMSSTFLSMEIALKELKNKYPERKFYSIDTKGIAMCSYNIASEIGDLFLNGKTIDEILEWADKEVNKFSTYLFVDNLTFFRRSGRVSSISAFVGNLLGIRPLIYIDSEGYMKPIDKVKGKINMINKIVELVEKNQSEIYSHRVVIAHSDNIKAAKMIGEKLKEKFGNNLNIEYIIVNPTSGAHCGPDGVGVCFHSLYR